MLNEHSVQGVLCCLEFSPAGFWLATGTLEGQVHIWDLVSSSVIYSIPPPNIDSHQKIVVRCISWCVDKRALLISYDDGTISEWCVPSNKHDQGIKSEVSLVATFYNANGQWIIVQSNSIKLIDGLVKLHEYAVHDCSAAAFSAETSTLFIGTGKGLIIALDANNLEQKYFSFETGSPVNQVYCHHHKANICCAVTKDRAVRIYKNVDNEGFKLEHKFFDVIERSAWASAGFSHDGEYAFGTVKSKSNHRVQIWELQGGTILSSLEGPREDVVSAKWHPKRPILACLSKAGRCSLWKPQYPKKWSALFPGMTEVEENVEYIEREDEFDEVQDPKTQESIVVDEHVDLSQSPHTFPPTDKLELAFFVQ